MTSISQERSRLAAVGMRLRWREEAGFRYPDYDQPRAVDEPATDQFVHITITNPDAYSSDDAHARAVESIGISRFPSVGVSYNRLIMQSGRAYEGQPIGRRGAHTVNDDQRSTCATSGCPSRGLSVGHPSVAWNLNYSARAYAICQNVDDPVTAAQLDSIARAIAADRLAGFVTRGARLHGHRCVSDKSCPADRMWALMGTLENNVNHYVTNGLDDMTVEDARQGARQAIVELWDEAANRSTTGGRAFGDDYAALLANTASKAELAETEAKVDALKATTDQLLALVQQIAAGGGGGGGLTADAVADELAQRLAVNPSG